ncbi:MAG: methyltransferase domain-containing protein [Kofleriaceae bacterium]|nr:methyltransferase domain-containing protein [Kofleriaceae bacterium]
MTDAPPQHVLLEDLGLRVYLDKRKSILRHYQDLFVQRYGATLQGEVIEIGGERAYGHERFFPRASKYRCTNIAREHDEYLDVTAMGLADASVDAFVCVSVLEHVFDIRTAIHEITRTLKPGGRLLLVVPFAFPQHDEVDFWRLCADAYPRLLEGFKIDAFVHLGGLFSTIADNLKRPKDRVTKRYFFHKLLGLGVVMLFRHFETLDGIPLGFGIQATRCG